MQEIQALFLSDPVQDFEMAPTIMTTTWPWLTPGMGLETAAPCISSTPGPMAGQGICKWMGLLYGFDAKEHEVNVCNKK